MTKAYIFDMDGTLVDNCAWHVKVWRAFAVLHGHEITEQQILEWMGAPSAYYMNRIFDREVPPEECAALTQERNRFTANSTRRISSCLTDWAIYSATPTGRA